MTRDQLVKTVHDWTLPFAYMLLTFALSLNIVSVVEAFFWGQSGFVPNLITLFDIVVIFALGRSEQIFRAHLVEMRKRAEYYDEQSAHMQVQKDISSTMLRDMRSGGPGHAIVVDGITGQARKH